MKKAELKKIIDKHTTCASDFENIWKAVQSYASHPSPMSAEQVEVLHAIMVLAEHGIPGYAFGDNEAACEMDNRLSEICRLASTTPSVKAEGWVSVEDGLPEPLETVWLSNGKGFTSLGCRTELVDVGDDTYNWCWAQSNGIIYEEKGKIVSECEDDDLDVKFWQPLPAPPKQQ